MPTERRVEKMRQVAARRQLDLHVVVDHIRDPHNASAILRSADAFGAHHINLLYTDHDFPEISEGVAAHAKKWLDIRRFTAADELIESLHADGVRVYATNLTGDALDYRDVDWTQPSAIVLGNEHRGCTQEVIDLADANVVIPMHGMAQSFNVSVSAGIILAEAARQRDLAGRYAAPTEAPMDAAREALLAEWVERERRRELRLDRQ